MTLLLALPPEFLGWSLFGLGAILLGGLGLLGRWTHWVLAALGPVLVLAAGALAFADTPGWAWQATLGLALVAGFQALIRTKACQGAGVAVLSLLVRPAGQASLLFVAGLLLLGWQFVGLDQPNSLATDPLLSLEQVVDLTPATGVVALTDEGSSVPLFSARALGDGLTATKEVELLGNQNLSVRVIQTDGPTLDYNCHGWVFTGGRHWVRGAAVEQILHDNRYTQVTNPQPGDLVVFRNKEGEVQHTGLVKVVADGLVLLESKWGQQGRYLHTPEQHTYRHCTCSYYHTERGGHLLRGFGSDKGGVSPTAPVSARRVPSGT